MYATNSRFWLVTILLRKFYALSKKEMKMITNFTEKEKIYWCHIVRWTHSLVVAEFCNYYFVSLNRITANPRNSLAKYWGSNLFTMFWKDNYSLNVRISYSWSITQRSIPQHVFLRNLFYMREVERKNTLRWTLALIVFLSFRWFIYL